jgi:hypothetical protein
MSAALLQDNDKGNELGDDRESCLHVLTWTALHFTAHTISGGGTNRFLRAFDEEYEDEGVRGGNLKRGFLATREIPCVVKFDRRPQLDALVRELTETFSVRYEEPPSVKDLQALEDAQVANVPESVNQFTSFQLSETSRRPSSSDLACQYVQASPQCRLLAAFRQGSRVARWYWI